MTFLPILRRSLQEGWRATIAWSAGIVGLLLLYLPLYPSISSSGDLAQMVQSLPPELINALGYADIASGAGYLHAAYHGMLGLVLLVIAATGWGSAAVAGAEESGRLELTLAHAVTRGQVLLESAAAILLKLLLLSAVGLLTTLALNGPSGLGLGAAGLLAAALALLLLAWLSAAAALAVGALSGRSSLATAAGAGLAVVAYLLNALAGMSPDLAALRDVSPLGWAFAGSPLEQGFGGVAWLPLIGLGLLLTLVALLALQRRDVGG